MATIDASKYTALSKLIAIRDNNYRGYHNKSGKVLDYNPESVDELIRIKQAKKADTKSSEQTKELEAKEDYFSYKNIDSLLDELAQLEKGDDFDAFVAFHAEVKQVLKDEIHSIHHGLSIWGENEPMMRATLHLKKRMERFTGHKFSLYRKPDQDYIEIYLTKERLESLDCTDVERYMHNIATNILHVNYCDRKEFTDSHDGLYDTENGLKVELMRDYDGIEFYFTTNMDRLEYNAFISRW